MEPTSDCRDARPRVLIIDRSSDLREVLETALARRGVTALGTRNVEEGWDLARQHRPDLIVLDDEALAGGAAKSAEMAADVAAADGSSVVVLGRWRGAECPVRKPEEVAKPYQYATLVRKIEELLARSGTARSSAA